MVFSRRQLIFCCFVAEAIVVSLSSVAVLAQPDKAAVSRKIRTIVATTYITNAMSRVELQCARCWPKLYRALFDGVLGTDDLQFVFLDQVFNNK